MVYWFKRIGGAILLAACGSVFAHGAGVGIVVNAGSAWLLMAGRKGDMNIRGAFLHLVGDAAVSVGVVVAAAGILWTGWNWLDPVASLVISLVIVWSSWGLLRDAAKLSLGAVPAGIDPANVRRYLESLPGVTGLHTAPVGRARPPVLPRWLDIRRHPPRAGRCSGTARRGGAH
jgi:cation diffusion facilitator family transporter